MWKRLIFLLSFINFVPDIRYMGDKLQFFGLFTIIIVILAGISLTWVLPQKQLAFAPTGDGGI